MRQGLHRRVYDWLYQPWLDWAQIEVSTDCPARCLYCPTTVLGKTWSRRHMTLADFRRILPMLARSTRPSPWRQPLLHLQGWGEPLLNPDFFAMVAAAKRAGLRVGTTSNGMTIDSAMAARIVQSGIDIISLSVAGIDQRNDAIRRGTRLDGVFDALAALDRHKKALQSATPSVHIAFMLLASGLDDVEHIAETFAHRGVDQIVVSTFDFVPDDSLRAEAVVPRTASDYETLSQCLGHAAAKAAEMGMSFHYRIPPPLGGQPGLCAEHVQAALIVTIDGEVTPCMFNRFGEQDPSSPSSPPYSFGNLAQQSLAEIWWSEPYLRFRRSFWNGTPPAQCLACSKLDRH